MPLTRVDWPFANVAEKKSFHVTACCKELVSSIGASMHCNSLVSEDCLHQDLSLQSSTLCSYMRRGGCGGWVHDDSSVELWAICGSSVRACILLESRESESERASSLGLSGKFVSLKCVSRVEKKHKLNSLRIGGRSIGPLVGGIASCQFFYRAWGTFEVTGCLCCCCEYILDLCSPTSDHHSLLFTHHTLLSLIPLYPYPFPLPPFPPTHIHSHVFLRAVPVPQGPHGEASH